MSDKKHVAQDVIFFNDFEIKIQEIERTSNFLYQIGRN